MDDACKSGFWLGKIEAALGLCGPASPARALERVERLVALEKAVRLNRQEAAAIAVWGGATRETYRDAAVLWDRRISDVLDVGATAAQEEDPTND